MQKVEYCYAESELLCFITVNQVVLVSKCRWVR